MSKSVWLFNHIKPELWALVINQNVVLNYRDYQNRKEASHEHADCTVISHSLESCINDENEDQENKVDCFYRDEPQPVEAYIFIIGR